MWRTIGVPAELERGLIGERTRAGARAAQRRSMKLGRNRKLTEQQIGNAWKLVAQSERPGDVAALFKVSRVTLYRAHG